MKIALIGNPNSGKTTLFNLLTGLNAKIGNWPGVTIEKKSGVIKNTNYEITDLPGIYSLSPYSIEEEISRKYVFDENPDVIINIIDATALERSLYLTTQLLELDCRVIVALNMADVLQKKGIKINIQKLEEILCTKIIKISALRGAGIKELINNIKIYNTFNKSHIYDSKIENSINKIQDILQIPPNKRFISVKLLEKDERFMNLETKEIDKIRIELEKYYETDLEETIAIQRYKFIEKLKKETVIKKIKTKTFSDKLDTVLLNKWFGIPIFIIIMFFIYYFSVGVIGNYTVDLISSFIEKISEYTKFLLKNINTSDWLISLIIDGIMTGVGSVLSFIPQLIILFFCISILEATGYMSRISLLLDKIFKKIGLSGKSLIPFIIGSGCSVPGIMGTRIIENQEEREKTVILTPFIPCTAKLPMIALFSGYFFGKNSGLISVSLYFLSILIIIFSAILMKKIVYKDTNNTYIAELPEYKLPNIKYVLRDVWDKVISFIKRAGTIILICSIIIWFLLSFSFKLEYGININNSILAHIGKSMSWIFYPVIGINSWEATVSIIQGLVAKEQVISSMSVISGLSEGGTKIFEIGSVFNFFTPVSGCSFMVFNLFSAPCFGAIAAMDKELFNSKKTIKAITFQTILAWFISAFIYQIGSRIEKGIFNITDILMISIILVILSKILLYKKEEKSECRYCPYANSCVR